MALPLNKKDLDILEERGYWKASSSLHKKIKRLIRKKLPIEIGYIKEAHSIIFNEANQSDMAGKYRQDNPELKRIDSSILKISHWHDIPNKMAELDFELKQNTKNLTNPQTHEEYGEIIRLSAKLSHKLTCIHPFENGNGRASRLLLGAVLLRAGLSDIAIKKTKPKYLRAMRQADDGNYGLLEEIITDGLIENQKKKYLLQLRKQAELAKTKRSR
jgi:Fic family protein